jgi:hypothetical protein
MAALYVAALGTLERELELIGVCLSASRYATQSLDDRCPGSRWDRVARRDHCFKLRTHESQRGYARALARSGQRNPRSWEIASRALLLFSCFGIYLSCRFHLIGYDMQCHGPLMQIISVSSIEPQRHAASDLMDGMVPSVEIDHWIFQHCDSTDRRQERVGIRRQHQPAIGRGVVQGKERQVKSHAINITVPTSHHLLDAIGQTDRSVLWERLSEQSS